MTEVAFENTGMLEEVEGTLLLVIAATSRLCRNNDIWVEPLSLNLTVERCVVASDSKFQASAPSQIDDGLHRAFAEASLSYGEGPAMLL